MLKRTLFIMILLVALATTAALAQDATPTVTPLPNPEVGPITQGILDRGSLICGVHTGLVGFANPNDAGEYQGFDVDFCRAVAAAILGDANAVTFRPLTAAERQPALASGEVDMIARNTTATLSRDTLWGASFAPTTFYDGQGIMVFADSGFASLEDLEGGTICTNAGTTTELNITDAMQSRGLEFELQTFPDNIAFMAAFREGRCDAVTSDISGLAGSRAADPDPGALQILDIVISKEPLGPLSPQNDEQFAEIVRWVVYGLIQAEEFGITSENIDEFLASPNPDIQRFLGVNGTLGATLNLPNDFMATVIRQVGNYGEIFERNLGAETLLRLERGVNNLWTNGGLLYALPFR
jgi:general L-amino acid transport system substrate-binding protein